MYFVSNIKKNPDEEVYYDMWLLTRDVFDDQMEGYFENMLLSRAQKDRSEKCCMDNIEGDFYYGAYGWDYLNTTIARRVIEYTPTGGM